MTLRQEVYELEVDALKRGEHVPVKLFSTAYNNCHIQRLQPKAANKHTVFLVTESEAITYNYELDLKAATLTGDPRIAHTLNLRTDEYGNIRQAVAVVYPRLNKYEDTTLPAGAVLLINNVQEELHIAYAETRYTNDVPLTPVVDFDNYRLRVPCEVMTYELTGIEPADNHYFTLDELRMYRLSEEYQKKTPDEDPELIEVSDISYHALPNPELNGEEKRLVEHSRTLFFQTNLTDPEPFGTLNRLGLPYENYKLALTEELLAAVFGDKLSDDVRLEMNAEPIRGFPISGYLSGAQLSQRFPGTPTTGQYWIRSGVAGFNADAAQHFYLPERYTDPFGNTTVLEYDGRLNPVTDRYEGYDLYIKSSTDPLGNRTEVTQFDFRVLSPKEIKDINDNLSEVAFDILGMPTAVAVKGKGSQADNLANLTAEILNPDSATLRQFFTGDYNEAEARRLLGNATARHLYYFGETVVGGRTVWGEHPPCASGILRETHVAQLPAGQVSKLQTAFEYSDGTGTVLVKKAQAEPKPGTDKLQWIASGKTILNNKGKPVKQYEPNFSIKTVNGREEPNHCFEEPQETGVTSVMYYDAPGRLIRTELPDGSLSRVEFSPWHVRSFDQNDTAYDPAGGNHSDWYRRRTDSSHLKFREYDSVENRRAAELVRMHANTHATVFLDSLGREVISVAHNKFTDRQGALHDEKYVTFTKLDAEGKPLWIRDARGNLVMQYITPAKANNDPSDDLPYRADPVTGQRIYSVPCYDIAGNLLFQHSMDAGDRWMLNDAAGKPMFAWDLNERQFNGPGDQVDLENRFYSTKYDPLHRPTELAMTLQTDNEWRYCVIEKFVYGETHPEATLRNLRGQLHQHYDQNGLQTAERYDFKGNALEVGRRLTNQYKDTMIGWQFNEAIIEWQLELETFVQRTEYDALNRMTRLFNWHRGTGSRVAVYLPDYNERGVLRSERLVTHARKTEGGDGYVDFVDDNGTSTQTTNAIEEITYSEKGQRLSLRCGNGTTTRYEYDSRTFRLKRLRTTRRGFSHEFPNSIGLKDPNILQNLYYTYDPVGNITETYDDAYEPAFFLNQRVEARSTYTYDALYRLITATGRENYHAEGAPDHRERPPFVVDFPVTNQALRDYIEYYSYDAVGNILQMDHAANRGSWVRNICRRPGLTASQMTNQIDAELAAGPHPFTSHCFKMELDDSAGGPSGILSGNKFLNNHILDCSGISVTSSVDWAISARRMEISNNLFEFTDPYVRLFTSFPGVFNPGHPISMVNLENVLISGNRIARPMDSAGIRAAGCDLVQVVGNTITNPLTRSTPDTLDHVGVIQITGNPAGSTYRRFGGRSLVADNVIISDTATNRTGIVIEDSVGGRITGNRVDGLGTGIYFRNSTQGILVCGNTLDLLRRDESV